MLAVMRLIDIFAAEKYNSKTDFHDKRANNTSIVKCTVNGTRTKNDY